MAKPENPHKDHRERVRKEFLANGFSDSTPPHKILELLLFFAIPRKDTNEIAHALLNRFGSISAVMEASPEELMRVDGIGESAATLIKLLLPIYRKYSSEKGVKTSQINSIDELGDALLKKYIGYTTEVFTIVTLNSKGSVIAFDVVGEGDVSSIGVSTRTIVEKVIERKAVAAVICHNHPNGNALPSNADLESTRRYVTALAHIGVQLLDHIIIADDDWVSLYQTPDYSHIFKV